MRRQINVTGKRLAKLGVESVCFAFGVGPRTEPGVDVIDFGSGQVLREASSMNTARAYAKRNGLPVTNQRRFGAPLLNADAAALAYAMECGWTIAAVVTGGFSTGFEHPAGYRAERVVKVTGRCERQDATMFLLVQNRTKKAWETVAEISESDYRENGGR